MFAYRSVFRHYEIVQLDRTFLLSIRIELPDRQESGINAVCRSIHRTTMKPNKYVYTSDHSLLRFTAQPVDP